MSSVVQAPKYYVFIAGKPVQFESITINSGYNQLASLNLTLHYSPYIMCIPKYTKVQVWSEVNGKYELEFDGSIVQKSKVRNLLGQVVTNFVAYTDGVIWNKRTRINFHIDYVLDMNFAGTGEVVSENADPVVTPFLQNIIKNNMYDVGCAAASVITSYFSGGKGTNSNQYYYFYNGKKFYCKEETSLNTPAEIVNAPYYTHFLNDFKLQHKVYGVTTSYWMKNFLQFERSVDLMWNTVADGSNRLITFWQMSMNLLQSGFYDVYNIPNPTFIQNDKYDRVIKTKSLTSTSKQLNESISAEDADKVKDELKSKSRVKQDEITSQVSVTEKKSYDGLAEYIFKPRNVLSLLFECNIIWPDEIIAENLTYNMFAEPTRVRFLRQQLPNGPGGENAALKKVYLGPYLPKTKEQNIDPSLYFGSYDTMNPKDNVQRNENQYSDYELSYGISYEPVDLNYAFSESITLSTGSEGGKAAKEAKRLEEDKKTFEEKVISAFAVFETNRKNKLMDDNKNDPNCKAKVDKILETLPKKSSEYTVNSLFPEISYSGTVAQYIEETYDKPIKEAQDKTLKAKEKVDTVDTRNISSYLNYEFAQRFYKTRNYSITVQPSVNIIAGLPVLILSPEGDHVIAFCLATTKIYDARGQMAMQVQLAYPHYYYEDVSEMGIQTDAIVNDPKSVEELSMIVGSKPLHDPTAQNIYQNAIDLFKKSEALRGRIEGLFNTYQKLSPDAREAEKLKYKRKVCTYSEYTSFMTGEKDSSKLNFNSNAYHEKLASIMSSASHKNVAQTGKSKESKVVSQDKVSCNVFKVYDRLNHGKIVTGPEDKYDPETGTVELKYPSNSTLVEGHNNFISHAQKI